jgi:hypothetical protein
LSDLDSIGGGGFGFRGVVHTVFPIFSRLSRRVPFGLWSGGKRNGVVDYLWFAYKRLM